MPTEKNFEQVTLDHIDLAILAALEENGKLGTKELAHQVGLTVSPTFERVRRLERQGLIEGYHAKINKKKLGIGLQVYCYVTLKAHNQEQIEAFEKEVVHLSEVVRCYHLAGQYDYSLFIEVQDIDNYQQFLKTKLASIPNISNVQSSFVLSSIK